MDGDLPAVGSLVWQLALRQLLVFMDGEHIVVLKGVKECPEATSNAYWSWGLNILVPQGKETSPQATPD